MGEKSVPSFEIWTVLDMKRVLSKKRKRAKRMKKKMAKNERSRKRRGLEPIKVEDTATGQGEPTNNADKVNEEIILKERDYRSSEATNASYPLNEKTNGIFTDLSG